MFELEKHADFLMTLYAPIISRYKMHFSFLSKNSIVLRGENCVITISTGRYYKDFIVLFRDPVSNKEYSLVKLMELKNLFDKEILTDQEVKIVNDQKDEVAQSLADTYFIIIHFCDDLLNGDFSIFNAV